MPVEIVGRESGFAYFKEGDEVRVNDDAVLAPETVRGLVGTVLHRSHIGQAPFAHFH